MGTSREIAARRITEIIPLVMRTLALEMRSTGYLPAPQHCGLLVALSRRPYNLTELAERHAVSLPTMSSSINTLAERGWVTRARAADDRRVVMIEITPAGRGVLGELTDSVATRVSELLAGLSAAEVDQLVESLELLRKCFARMTECERAGGLASLD
jgi:DNA-binding MarR family transcriptional regulator